MTQNCARLPFTRICTRIREVTVHSATPLAGWFPIHDLIDALRLKPATVAVALAAAFIVIAAFHVYWALATDRMNSSGAGAIPTRADGTPLLRPGRAGTLGVALLLVISSLLVLHTAGLLELPGHAIAYRKATWLLAMALVLRTIGDFKYVGLFKRERQTRFAALDTRIYTPLCGALGAGVIYLILVT